MPPPMRVTTPRAEDAAQLDGLDGLGRGPQGHELVAQPPQDLCDSLSA